MPYIIIAVVVVILIVAVRMGKAQRAASEAAERERLRKEEQQKKEAEARRKKEEQEATARRIRAELEAEAQRILDKYPEARKWRVEKLQEETTSHLMSITDFTAASKRRYVAFDLETTGLNSGEDAIVEIGAVRVENGQITAEFQQLVNPGRSMPAEASAINHITDAMLIGQPTIQEALPAFLAFIGDDVLAAHNARFDAGFINQACMRNRYRVPETYFDTMNLARYWPEAYNKKLGTLAAAAGIENDDAHRALGDARTVAALITATNEARKAKRKGAKT